VFCTLCDDHFLLLLCYNKHMLTFSLFNRGISTTTLTSLSVVGITAKGSLSSEITGIVEAPSPNPAEDDLIFPNSINVIYHQDLLSLNIYIQMVPLSNFVATRSFIFSYVNSFDNDIVCMFLYYSSNILSISFRISSNCPNISLLSPRIFFLSF
jgi:hypothetical protein